MNLFVRIWFLVLSIYSILIVTTDCQIISPGFEGVGNNAPTAWTQFSSLNRQILCNKNRCSGGFNIYAGSWYAWFGRGVGAQLSYCQQAVSIPIGIVELRFAFYSTYTDPSLTNRFSIFIDSIELFYVNGSNFLNYNPSNYTMISITIPSNLVDGQNHILKLQNVAGNSSINFSNVYIDEINFVGLSTTSEVTTNEQTTSEITTAESTTAELTTVERTTAESTTQFETSPINEKKASNSSGIIVGCVIGGVICIVFFVLLAIFLTKSKKKREERKTSPQIIQVDPLLFEKRTVPVIQKRGTISSEQTSVSKRSTVSTESYKDEGSVGVSALTVSKIFDSKKSLINYDELMIREMIGKGAYGEVYFGIWRETQVAVKKVIKTDMSERELREFEAEAELLISLRPHPNVVLFLGVTVPPQPITIVTEFCERGSLHSFMKQNEPLELSIKYEILLGISRGILHLHMENIIHRDLAARNILLTSEFMPKVSDFGLAREQEVGESRGEESKTTSVVGPLRWMSPEAIQRKVYSVKSDSWAYGVVCWEVLCDGKTPYEDLDIVNVAMEVVRDGRRLEIPEQTPVFLSELMKQCWETDPSLRPNFKDICSAFASAGIGKKLNIEYRQSVPNSKNSNSKASKSKSPVIRMIETPQSEYTAMPSEAEKGGNDNYHKLERTGTEEIEEDEENYGSMQQFDDISKLQED